MKLRLTYLLLLGLLFFKAYSYTASSANTNVISLQKIYSNSSSYFTDHKGESSSIQSSLFIEDTEDDDDSYDKKRVILVFDYDLFSNVVGIISQPHSSKDQTTNNECLEYSFPERYIFARSIRI